MSRLVLMGSGETSPSMVSVHRQNLAVAGTGTVTLIDTPFGFQENAPNLIERISGYFSTSLGAEVAVASLPGRMPDEVTVAKFRDALIRSSFVFAGPGSPTYALDIWETLDVGRALAEVIGRGGVVTLASAAALTAGTHTIPVYEIYKVGAVPRLRTGLGLTAALGLPLMVVPHWNNAEGGNHDTSRCFIGRRRFEWLVADLDVGILGIDEHTAAVIDLSTARMTVAGLGTVTVLGGEEMVIPAGTSIPLDALVVGAGEPRIQTAPPVAPAISEGATVDRLLATLFALEEKAAEDPAKRAELRTGLVELARSAEKGLIDPKEIVGDYVALLLELRAAARDQRRFEEADRIRGGLEALGVEVQDTPVGPRWEMR